MKSGRMKVAALGLAIGLMAGIAAADIRDETYPAGDQQVWIEVKGGGEVMWVGPSESERTPVLTAYDIEIDTFATDELGVALLGVPAIVVTVGGTHSCEAGDAVEYYVVTLGASPVTDGPLTACEVLQVSLTDGMIFLEADPMQINGDGGTSWIWEPGRGFRQ